MKRDYDKRVFHNFKSYNIQEVEEYLNEMAGKGFFLLEITDYQMFFKQDTPRKVRYSSVYVPHEENWPFYRKYAKSLGWDYVCTMKKFQIFLAEDETKPFVESDETNYEVIQMVREKQMIYTVLKLCALVIAAIGFSYYIGLSIIFLSVHGLGFTLMGILYGILLVSLISDTLYWKKQSEKKLQRNEPLSFRFCKITKRIQRSLYIALFITYFIVVLNACYRWVISLLMDGFEKSKTILMMMLFYIVIYTLSSILGKVVRREFKKRGAYLNSFAMSLFMISWLLVCNVVINGFGSGASTYSPEILGLECNKENSSGHIDAGKSVLGSRENYHFTGSNKEGYYNFSYSYSLYKSKFPIIQKWIMKDALRIEHLNQYLSVYKQTENYKVYIADNKKFYPETATYQTFDTDLEYYDGCIVIQKPEEILKFYYKNFGKKSVDDILMDLNYE